MSDSRSYEITKNSNKKAVSNEFVGEGNTLSAANHTVASECENPLSVLNCWERFLGNVIPDRYATKELSFINKFA